MENFDFYSNPYSKRQKEKEATLITHLNALTQHHKQNCQPYAHLLDLFYPKQTEFSCCRDIPYFPVNLFKTQKLMSISPDIVFKILESSGTTSSHSSKIYLDSETAQQQTAALASIMTSFLGKQRLPMLILDHPNVIRDRHQYNARGAAIVGMMNFGRDFCYAFDEKMILDRKRIQEWLSRHSEEPILLFGLTFVVWEYFFNNLSQNELKLPKGILFHTGGWKKLQEQSISNVQFKEKLFQTTKINRCHNFYGMVEQVGSIFVECEQGYLHCPEFADIIVRNPKTWNECQVNESGVIQVLSILPKSYPGHSLITEDLGVVRGVDDCSCGRHGKYFEVLSRVPQAEIRGCSDSYAYATTER